MKNGLIIFICLIAFVIVSTGLSGQDLGDAIVNYFKNFAIAFESLGNIATSTGVLDFLKNVVDAISTLFKAIFNIGG